MKVACANEMRECDRKAIMEYGIPGIVLMENAGLEVFRQIEKLLGDVADKKIVVLAGKGNNGGDGYVVARHLLNKGAVVKVFVLGTKAEISGDAAVNLHILEAMEADLTEIDEQTGQRAWNKLKLAVKISHCVVDALLGTGFKGELKGDMVQAIDIINNFSPLTVAIDIPSGVDTDTGLPGVQAVQAAYTVTFGLPKIGILLYPGALYAGKLIVADITIPTAVLTSGDIKQNAASMEMVKQMLPKRSKEAHKGMNGRALVVAGSRGLSGAAFMAAMGAVRAGAGLVTLATPLSLCGIMAAKLTEVMTNSLPETPGGTISAASSTVIANLARNCQVLAVGPGLGQKEELAGIMRLIIKEAVCPLVIDADGLNALAGQAEILRDCAALPVLTPHTGEMSRLTGLSVEAINANRLEIARRFAGEWGCVLVLKGARTIVAFPDGEVYINTTGNEGMATGGMGDVLTGVIAGFVAQGMSSCDAAVAGVYIHGLAGDIAAQKGMIGLAATDVLETVPAAIYSVQQS